MADRARRADTLWERMVGLLNRKSIAPGEALIIPGCSSIHMIGMRFPIDAAFFRADGTVCGLMEGLKPGQVPQPVWDAKSVIEFPAGTLKQHGVRVGDGMDIILDTAERPQVD